MPRIAGVDIPGSKRTVIALTLSEYHFWSLAQSESPHASTAARVPLAR